MKQLPFDFYDGREPSLRDLMHQAGLETSTDVARRQYVARKAKRVETVGDNASAPRMARRRALPLRRLNEGSVDKGTVRTIVLGRSSGIPPTGGGRY